MLSIVEINEQLENLPSLIARTAEEAEEARVEYEQVKNVFEAENAKELLQQKASNPKLTQAEIKALVELTVNHLRLDVLLAESKWKKLLIKVEEYDNMFTGIKMLARLRQQELSTLIIGGEKKDGD